MTTAAFYYLLSKNKEWVLHKKGCDEFIRSNFKIFIGTLYTDGQAIGTAKRHVNIFSLCQDCISKFEVGQH
ncbi:hypothetical protein [Erwinia sp.]|uniref:hypothetical protein n=1 Tax=Erwinia citreus TaxID=558 RepID=UPI003C74FFEE